MSDNKKYYYLKLKDSFFDSDSMILLESMDDGYIYSNILLKLYLKSLKDDGRLVLNGRIPYNAQMIARVTRHQVGTVEKALEIFVELGLVEVLDNGVIYMLDIQNFIGESSTEADRKKAYRARIESERLAEQMSGQTSGQMSDKCLDKRPPEIEKEIEIDIDIEKEINKAFCPEMNSGQPQPKVEIGPAAENGTKVEIGPSRSEAELMVETGPAQADVFIRLPLIGGKDFTVTKQYVSELQELYPAVNVEQALRSMKGWLDSNPKNRKTARGIKRFITGWISRDQDRAPRRQWQQDRPSGQERPAYTEMYKDLPVSSDDPFQ